MNLFEAIKTRQSIRSYTSAEVEQEKINLLVEAANAAPIFGIIHISVIKDKDFIQTIGDITKNMMVGSGNAFAVKQASNPAYNPTYSAPVLMVLSAKGGNDSMGFNIANVSCAAQNILLAATDLQLASCFVMAPMMSFSDNNIATEANIPSEFIPLVGVCIGYTNSPLEARNPASKNNVTYC